MVGNSQANTNLQVGWAASLISTPTTACLHKATLELCLSWPAPISPFVHVLAGIGRIRTAGISDSSFSAAIGGGFDMHLAPFISWRIFQADDVVTRFFGGTQNNARFSTGLVFRF